MKQSTIAQIVFLSCPVLLTSCISNKETHTNNIQSALAEGSPEDENTSEFRPSLAGMMAELGQNMDDVYRFWDSPSMRAVSIERLKRMIEIHDECLAMYDEYLESIGDNSLKSESARFEGYLLKSKDLTILLQKAILNGDNATIKEAFQRLDRNRRNAHSVFG